MKKTNRIVTVEEGWPFAGIGAEIAMQIIEQCFDWLDAPPVRVHGLDVPLPYAANLEKLALPQPDWVVDAVQQDRLSGGTRDGHQHPDAGAVARP